MQPKERLVLALRYERLKRESQDKPSGLNIDDIIEILDDANDLARQQQALQRQAEDRIYNSMLKIAAALSVVQAVSISAGIVLGNTRPTPKAYLLAFTVTFSKAVVYSALAMGIGFVLGRRHKREQKKVG